MNEFDKMRAKPLYEIKLFFVMAYKGYVSIRYPAAVEAIREEVIKRKQVYLIEKITNPYYSPVVCVNKPNRV